MQNAMREDFKNKTERKSNQVDDYDCCGFSLRAVKPGTFFQTVIK